MDLAGRTNFDFSISSLAHSSVSSSAGVAEVGNFLLYQAKRPSDWVAFCVAFPGRWGLVLRWDLGSEE